MLCRTANDLYWLSRHVERVDNTARLLDLAHRIALLPEQRGGVGREHASWGRALEAVGQEEAYAERHGAVQERKVIEFLLLDPENPSSVFSCVHAARESGRAQRTAITADMYEDLNSSWLRVRDLDWDQLGNEGLAQFVEWLKRRSAGFRGITVGTMRRDEAYEFLRLGTFVERADFGLRLMDVNFGATRFGDRPEARSAVEYYQMNSLLQAMSAMEAFRRIFRDIITPQRVAELMILRPDMPRSLAMCTSAIHDVLEVLLGGRSSAEVMRLAGVLAAETRYGRIADILAGGMHEYLERFIERLYRLSEHIDRQFMIASDVVAA